MKNKCGYELHSVGTWNRDWILITKECQCSQTGMEHHDKTTDSKEEGLPFI